MSHKNCTLRAVQRQSDGWEFNVMAEHQVPLVSRRTRLRPWTRSRLA
jgi:hypothetical protein